MGLPMISPERFSDVIKSFFIFTERLKFILVGNKICKFLEHC